MMSPMNSRDTILLKSVLGVLVVSLVGLKTLYTAAGIHMSAYAISKTVKQGVCPQESLRI